ncbi:hypothetical protein ACHAWO_000861 [Cyclotella atomus]|uniref:ABC transmembrane type-1 domain-containing protein n=1 Tax=Cyclotella atomus TaxID=382360 RepID=A0ABD3N951_9STRA
MKLLEQELITLCIGFAGVGGICLVTGFAYVSIWTCTGEQQALRIQKEFVRAYLNQDAARFDQNNHDTFQILQGILRDKSRMHPCRTTKLGTSLVHISNAICRQVADVYSCMAVALLLNTPLALIMLCEMPVASTILDLFNVCIRRVKKRSSAEMAHAGGWN